MDDSRKPIYQLIRDAIQDGELPADFTLPEPEGAQNRVKWAPGAMDGVGVYHMGCPKIPEEALEKLLAAVRTASAGNYEEAYQMLLPLGETYRAIHLIDHLQRCIYDHLAELDQKKLYLFAIDRLMTQAADTECVKFGLEILEMYNNPNAQIKEDVRALGACDEFTIFAIFNMQRWPDANEEIFRLAQKVHGWGRVHAVERLKPETQEIRDWMLHEGWRNEVLAEYSALPCYQKAGVEERLKGTLSHEDFSAIGQLLVHMLDEAPAPGISAIENAADVFRAFFSHAAVQPLTITDYDAIFSLANYAEEHFNDAALAAQGRELLQTDACKSAVRDALTRGTGVELAIALGIPYREPLLRALREDFEHNYALCRWLMDEPESAEQTLAIFREHILPESIEQDPRDELGFGPAFAMYSRLDLLIQELRSKPMLGIDYLERTLLAPTTHCRHMSVRVLKSWVSQTKQPLSKLSPPLWDCLKNACEREPREDIRAAMQTLLDGTTDYPENEM